MSVHVTLSVGRGLSRDGQGLPIYDSAALAHGALEGVGVIPNLSVPRGSGVSQIIARIINLGDTPVGLVVNGDEGDSAVWPLVPGIPLDLYVRTGDQFSVENL